MANATVDGGVDCSLTWTAAMSPPNSSVDTAAMPLSLASSVDSSSSICHRDSVGTRSAEWHGVVVERAGALVGCRVGLALVHSLDGAVVLL